MAKARVYELAKELGVGNKEILEQLKKKNVEVKNHMSTVEDNVAEEFRRKMPAEMKNLQRQNRQQKKRQKRTAECQRRKILHL